MLHQDLITPAYGYPRHEWSSIATLDVIGLLANARSSLDEDTRITRLYLDQIAALIAESKQLESLEGQLIPAVPAAFGRSAGKGGLAAWQLQRVSNHIDRALDRPIANGTLAGLARLSPGYFCRAFRASVGEAPHAFLIRQRIRRAQILMLRSDETLSQIACSCGLTDQAHLTRLFRKMVGETPLSWRKSRRQPVPR